MTHPAAKRKLPLQEGLLQNARELRGGMTEAEERLWYHLRAGRFLGYKFRRQMPLPPYVLDFCCVEQRLVIELDGSQHALLQPEDGRRTAYLEAKGFRVLRFWNNDVLSRTESVLEQIRLIIEGLSLTPAPLPEGEGRKN